MTTTWTATTGQWVWLPGEETPANAYAQFRKAFALEAVPTYATIHVSADCRYRLLVNGAIVGRGPIATPPRYKQVDVYEVAKFLQPGENEITALVLQRHHHTSRLYAQRGGFLLQLDAGKLSLGTDSSWQARWATEYTFDAPLMSHQYGHQEWLDARKEQDGWEPALLVERPEQYWQSALEVRSVPYMRRQVIHPVRVVSYFGLSSYGKPPESDPEPALQIMKRYPMSSIVA